MGHWVTTNIWHIVGIMVPDIHAKFHNQPFIMRQAIWWHTGTCKSSVIIIFRLSCVLYFAVDIRDVPVEHNWQYFILSLYCISEINSNSCLRTDSHTIKPPTAGVQLVGHTSTKLLLFDFVCGLVQINIGVRANIHLGGQTEWWTQIVFTRPPPSRPPPPRLVRLCK